MRRLTPDQMTFLAAVRAAMEAYFDTDRRRIDHALQVSEYATRLLDTIEADPLLTLCAACLHDIGIHEAERRHGSDAGNWQELEGPPIARRMLENLAADEALIVAVCELVGRHHTPAGVDSAEFRILWDADALVNFSEVLPGKPEQDVERLLKRHMATEPGYRLARKLFAPEAGGSAGCMEKGQGA